MRKNYSSGLGIEDQVGYSRAVQVGDVPYVSATAPVDENLTLVGSTGYEQAAYVLSKIVTTLETAGFAVTDVVMVRLYFSDGERSEDAYRAFHETFGSVRPAIAVVNVTPCSIPGMLLEIEVQAHRS